MKIAVWNIGHFSGGNGQKTAIPQEKLDVAKATFRHYINEAIGADVIGICEHSAMLCNADQPPISGPIFAKDALFDAYAISYEGAQHNYSGNAVFAKADTALTGVRRKIFTCNESAKITHTDVIRASDYYYLKGTVSVGGAPVTLVVCHLAFDMKRNPDTVNIDQIRELIEVLKNEERVIIAGDFNCRDFAQFDLFRAAGYALGNDGSLITCPTASSNKALDNIIVKGVTVTNVRVHETALSDHHALSADITL